MTYTLGTDVENLTLTGSSTTLVGTGMFGTAAQALQSLASLQDTSPRLS